MNINIDFDEFKNLNPKTPGAWPWTAKFLACGLILLVIVILGWVLDWQAQWDSYQQIQSAEEGLKATFMEKKKDAINLDLMKKQLIETEESFGALLKQLPNKSEIAALLTDINQAGLGRGLLFDSFRPGPEKTVKGTFAEQPIAIRVSGAYDDLGNFSSDIASLPRIVTLTQIAISLNGDKLSMDAQAKTYRYLNDAETAEQQKTDAPPPKGAAE
ncbi:MAG: type 4a pilus biogenesis protein PilO [Gallionella sp.]